MPGSPQVAEVLAGDARNRKTHRPGASIRTTRRPGGEHLIRQADRPGGAFRSMPGIRQKPEPGIRQMPMPGIREKGLNEKGGRSRPEKVCPDRATCGPAWENTAGG